MKYPKRRQYKHAKCQYRIRNWSEYEAGLKKRGHLVSGFRYCTRPATKRLRSSARTTEHAEKHVEYAGTGPEPHE
jgi:hypothetical protein